MKKIISYLLLVFVSACIVSILLIFWILFIKLRNCWELTFDQKLSLLLDKNTSFEILNQYCIEKNQENEEQKEFNKLFEVYKTYSWCSLLENDIDFNNFLDNMYKKLDIDQSKDFIDKYNEASYKIKKFCIREQLKIQEKKLWFFPNVYTDIYTDNIEKSERNLLMLKKIVQFEKENWTLFESYNSEENDELP